MAATLVKEGRGYCLNALLAATHAELRVILFKNAVAITLDTDLGDLAECDFSGYLEVTPSWLPVVIDGANNASSTGSVASFLHNGGAVANNVWGWALIALTSGRLLFAETFTAAKVMGAAGDYISVQPVQIFTQG